MDWIDLRSDTVTHPTRAMREAMANAEVGDDVLGEDPTVRRLEEMAAALMDKESGLFVPSGTMGNLAAILAHCDRGDEIILGDKAHAFLFEAGGVAALGGIHPHPIPNQSDGTLAVDDIGDAIRPDDAHFPITRLICLENTHNRCGGVALSAEYTRQVGDLAHASGLALHVDGARIFNAAVSQGVEARELAQPADSVTFCLSKALCAPVGSMICGDKDFIRRAHRMRKQLGGGMRQAGVIAAAGIVALDTMIGRLAEDHERTRCLADRLINLPGIEVENYPPQTNMIYFRLTPQAKLAPDELAQRLLQEKIKLDSGQRTRLVLHYWIDDKALEQVIRAFESALDR